MCTYRRTLKNCASLGKYKCFSLSHEFLPLLSHGPSIDWRRSITLWRIASQRTCQTQYTSSTTTIFHTLWFLFSYNLFGCLTTSVRC